MELTGGVLVIGSLIWEDDLESGDSVRKYWRCNNLASKIIETPAPIRYGRESNEKRNHTYTMVFSSACEVQPGKALALPFNKSITSFEQLHLQAIALAIAEGIYKKNNPRICSSWGSVGLLLNPQLEETNRPAWELIKSNWKVIYSDAGKFVADSYKANDENTHIINRDGILNIGWRKEMNAFDLLLATPVIPDPPRMLSAKEIAVKMVQKKYSTYFEENRRKGIETFQDQEILTYLQAPSD